MKILVTGANGQLGNNITRILGKEHQLVTTDVENMDITDIEEIKKIVKRENPDYVIHAAAYTQVDNAENNIDLCRKINALGTKNIAIIVKEFNIKLIYISTDFVLGGQKNVPYSEGDEVNPLSVYGLTKYEGEEFIKEICEKYYIIRTSWLFGEFPNKHRGTNFVEKMLQLAKEGGKLSVVDDQIGSPTYIGDLVETMSIMIKKSPPFGIYNFSGTGECSWYDFAKEIFLQANIKVNLTSITSSEYPQKAKRPPYSYLDKSKIEKTLNTRVRPWQKMLTDYLLKKKYD